MGIIKKITAAARNQKTYRVGLLQTKAYRILKQATTDALAHLEITSTHWAFLGLLDDQKKGMRPADAARELIVEAPFVTQMFRELKALGLVESLPDQKDTRAKLISLTTKGKAFVIKTEVYLRKEIKPVIKNAEMADLLSYIIVLEQIVSNYTSKNNSKK